MRQSQGRNAVQPLSQSHTPSPHSLLILKLEPARNPSAAAIVRRVPANRITWRFDDFAHATAPSNVDEARSFSHLREPRTPSLDCSLRNADRVFALPPQSSDPTGLGVGYQKVNAGVE